jgi:hypothetical protein
MNADERTERAYKAATARWGKKEAETIDWDEMPLDDAQNKLVELIAEVEKGRRIVQQRIGEYKNELVKCDICERVIRERWVSKYDFHNKEGVIVPHYLCSPACDTKFQIKRRGGVIRG